MEVLSACSDAELVGLVDVDLATARSALAVVGLEHVASGTSLSAVAASTGAQAVVNVTVPEAHRTVTVEALFSGLPVLCEKPLAPTVHEGLSLVAASEASGQLLVVSQTRRYYRTLAAFKAMAGSLGKLGVLTTEFFKAPHFGGFREEMDHVLLLDMAIHAFDVARYLLDSDPIAVYCDESNPGWSWYASGAAAFAIFEFSGGARYIYTGSWCSDGYETSWNGRWRVSGERGSALWDGDGEPEVECVPGAPLPAGPQSTGSVGHEPLEDVEASLAEFIHGLRTGTTPSCEVHANVLSLVMMEAAVRSAETRQRVVIDRVLAEAFASALELERHPAIRQRLAAWPNPVLALRSGATPRTRSSAR